ncbi:ABC transporter substrate-binding protein [Pseudoflavonifractor sp. AF19-9AC]|uniref:ABC transporter substrate-binding protein n=1 Tax=Pseudoflavonifractor sp. AF19-9AC TaxID=2292244 RepID=UPI0018F722AF|nr:ABC transporter substrate-binding protein [Pseudoflavonifractor sp. AF19-9AC]
MKKHNIVKKLTALTLSLAMAMTLAACSSGSSSSGSASSGTPSSGGSSSGASGDGYKIAVVRQLDHPSMNEIRDAITAELDVKADELGVSIEYRDFSGNNDTSALQQIGAEIIAGGYDAIIPIGTLAAQQMAVSAQQTQTPVIYGTVSYPEVAKLTGIPYVTGTSDALNVELILDMMLAQNPDVKTVGLLYSTSELNSAPAIEDAKAYLDSKNISYIEKTGNTSDEIIAAVSSLVGQVDAVFTPTDNVVQAAELAIAPTLIQAGIPHYAGADSFVRNGAFATCGVNYTDLGTQTADLALQVLQTGEFPDYITVSGDIITVNTETAAALGADYSMFADMSAQLVEVQTTQD